MRSGRCLFCLPRVRIERRRESKNASACSPLYVATGLPLEVALHSGSFSGLLQVQFTPAPRIRVKRLASWGLGE